MAAAKEKDTIEKTEITKTELGALFQQSVARKIKINLVEMESKTDLKKTLETMRVNFNRMLDMKTNDLTRKYEAKLKELDIKNPGALLFKIHNLIIAEGWILSINNYGKLVVTKVYKPAKDIINATHHGELLIYKTKICSLKSIELTLDQARLYKLVVTVEGTHPNIDGSMTCTGNLLNRIIPLENPKKFLSFLHEIEQTYLIPSLDSAYSRPAESRIKSREKRGWSVRK